jgi:serine/threonine-protein kinase
VGTQDSLGLLGATIAGRYRVDAVAGEGGFGIVYRGHHLGFDRAVAIKCLKVPPHFSGDARRMFVDRFAEEGKLLFRLSEHRSIVRVFDHGVVDIAGQAIPFLVLEWLDGMSLADCIADRRARGAAPMPELEALRLLREPIEGLAYAHQLRVAHRDIKPANLFVMRGGVVRLLDFGVAKLMEEADAATQYATQTSSGFRAFSPNYGAPEQFYSKAYGQTGPWTDVHAIGLILTELVTGRPAFDSNDFGELYAFALRDPRPTPRACGAAVSPQFEALCATALAREPRNRFRSAVELLEAVDALIAAGEAPAQAVPRGRSRGKLAVLAAASALVSAAAIAVAVAATRPHERAGTLASPPPPDAGTVAVVAAPPRDAAPAKPEPPVVAAPDANDSIVAGDGAVFRPGDAVFVRRDPSTFATGRVDRVTRDDAVVDGARVRLDDISPAARDGASSRDGAIVLVASKRDASVFVGKVVAGGTVKLWDGRAMRSVAAPNDELDRPVRARDAWQAELATFVEKKLDKRATGTPNAFASKQNACVRYCVDVAGHQPGTPGYAACVADQCR